MAGLKQLFVTFQANPSPALQAINALNKRIDLTATKLNKTSDSLLRFGGQMGVFLSAPIALFGKSAIDATADLQSLQTGLELVLEKYNLGIPIQEAATKEIENMRQTADELGVSLDSIQKSYIDYLASSQDSLEVTRKTIKTFLGLGTVLGVPAENIKLVVKALAQMQGKGQVMAEELKGQLGDSFPIAMRLFAEAAGKGMKEFTEAMQRGEIGADIIAKVSDLIEKKYTKNIASGAQKMRAQLSRLGNSWLLLKQSFGDGLNEILDLTNLFKNLASWLKKVANNFALLDDRGKKLIIFALLFITVISPLIILLGAVGKNMFFIASALKSLLTPWGLMIAGLSAAIFYWDDIQKIWNATPNYIKKITVMLGAMVAIFKIFNVVLQANPFLLLVSAAGALIANWSEVVEIFKSVYEWISKIVNSGIQSIQNAFGFGDGMPKANNSQLAQLTSPAGGLSSNNSVTNNLTVNIPSTVKASDATSVKESVKQALLEERKQAYRELAVQ